VDWSINSVCGNADPICQQTTRLALNAACGQPFADEQVSELADDLITRVLDEAVVSDPANLAQQVRRRLLLNRAIGEASELSRPGLFIFNRTGEGLVPS